MYMSKLPGFEPKLGTCASAETASSLLPVGSPGEAPPEHAASASAAPVTASPLASVESETKWNVR